tara:strand:- start:400 stop:573 length:174 start_codon:yes stop_codon:yes gene_type:complete
MKNYEIVERSSGYWVVDGEGYAQGPYDTIKDADDDVPPNAQLQYPLKKVFDLNVDPN